MGERMSDIKQRYTFVTQEGQNWTCVGIRNGIYDGVIIKYGRISVAEAEDEKGNLPFKFEYDIVDPNGLLRETFDEEFFTLIGDILVDILDEQLQEDNLDHADN